MDAFWLDILTNAGPMVLFVVWLLWRDRQRDQYQERVTDQLIERNTEALLKIAEAIQNNADEHDKDDR
jgi:hypothetical protein